MSYPTELVFSLSSTYRRGDHDQHPSPSVPPGVRTCLFRGNSMVDVSEWMSGAAFFMWSFEAPVL